jgi:hypothetical protein
MRIAIALVLTLCAAPLAAQDLHVQKKLSGPRVGVTVITGSNADRMRDDHNLHPLVTQFGWQFETELFATADRSVAALTELVPLVGGLEQGVFIPSVSWLVGLRTANGAEVGVGPNLSVAGPGLAFAGGVTASMGDLHLPLNVAMVPSRGGMRFSVLTGFNIRRS